MKSVTFSCLPHIQPRCCLVAMPTISHTRRKAAFIPQLALFPVHWLDEDMCVFEFPPLNSKIGCVKIATNQPRALTSDDE